MAASKKDQKIDEVPLEAVKDVRLGITLMRVTKEITLHEGDLIQIMPGEKGYGWVLKDFGVR